MAQQDIVQRDVVRRDRASSVSPVLELPALSRAPPGTAAHHAQRTTSRLLIPTWNIGSRSFDYLLCALVLSGFGGRRCTQAINRKIAGLSCLSCASHPQCGQAALRVMAGRSYTVDHAAFDYPMDANGAYPGLSSPTTAPEPAAETIRTR